ncbi:Pentatricopeptide repeat-containing protein [Raphanus sativus]|uniref:Pentatricopeptide repeat-containing protein At1g31430-like n=1 Tax=Raphanus sativus TaxID=3726 RepID=A0A9W3C9H6_RAPSA|nr:pentatricopeptide repeat-containing protein At1g31430-like [Raphanus sativus]XP_056848068.1 pentatricopeptide repeat-containing protein At1g31430-like [Raphanus sativus]KAJ4881279.1 Pentatricopeptide repeat-containing protein [Raphanus sativus]
MGPVQTPSLIAYNKMLKSFADTKTFTKVLSLFAELRRNALYPDNFTLPIILKSIGRLRNVAEGEKIHGYALKSGLNLDPYVCNSLMGMYAALGKMEIARKVFDEMPERDVVSWNGLISSYVGHGRFDDAVAVFKRMSKESDLKPDESTIVSTLSACSALKNLELGEVIHRYVVAVGGEFETSVKIGNALVDMFCKCGCLDKARGVFESMRVRNVKCWTSMVSGYVSNGRVDEGRELFERSPVKDVVLWTAMMNGYVRFRRFDEALELFRRMQSQGVRPDNFVLVSLLKGCSQTGALEQGKWIHGYICENRVRVDKVVGTALVDMYAKCGCIETALEVFYETRERDTASWTSLIYGLAMNGMSRRAMDLYYEMENGGVRLDDITFVSVLTACNHGGFVGEGRGVFYSMSNVHKIRPKSEHYSCMIDLLCRAGCLEEAEELIDKMRDGSDKTLVPVYCSLLSAARNYGNVELAERVAEKLEKVEVSDSSAHTLLASVYASANKWEDVTNVRSKMKDLGIRKFPGCSSVEIDGVPHESIVGDTSSSSSSHPKVDEIKYNAVSNYKLDVEFGT